MNLKYVSNSVVMPFVIIRNLADGLVMPTAEKQKYKLENYESTKITFAAVM